MIVCKAVNARNKADNQDNEKMNYEKEMEKCLNSIFRNLRALEEIRRVRVPQRCEEVKKELQKKLLTQLVRLAQVTTVHKSSAVKNERDKIGLHGA